MYTVLDVGVIDVLFPWVVMPLLVVSENRIAQV